MNEPFQADAVNEVSTYAHVVSVRHLRAEQQDAALVSPWVCAIADGLGGHDRGAEASRVALATLATAVSGPRDDRTLRADVSRANRAVCALATTRHYNPGTTLVVVSVSLDFDGVVVGWCGDSRAWIVDGDAVECCTVDHTEFLGGLSRCLGAPGSPVSSDIETVFVPAGSGVRLLLTTDGVHGGISERAEAIFPGLLAAGLEHLVRVGTEHGRDNATAVLLDVDAFVANAASIVR